MPLLKNPSSGSNHSTCAYERGVRNVTGNKRRHKRQNDLRAVKAAYAPFTRFQILALYTSFSDLFHGF